MCMQHTVILSSLCKWKHQKCLFLLAVRSTQGQNKAVRSTQGEGGVTLVYEHKIQCLIQCVMSIITLPSSAREVPGTVVSALSVSARRLPLALRKSSSK